MPKQPPRPERTERPTGLLARVRAHLRTRSRGQSLVEFGLILPVFLLFLATTLDLGRLALARVTVTNAARVGAFQAAETPTSFDSTQPCPADASSNLVVCRVQLEAKSSGVTIAPGDIALTCNLTGCPQLVPSYTTVTVTGHFTLLTPILSTFFGNSQNITFTASSTTQIKTLPAAPGAATPAPTATPTPTPTGTGPTPTPTSPTCEVPSADFSWTPTDLSNIHAPFTLSVTDKSSSPNCAIDSWVWDWGDGWTSVGQLQPPHTYTAKGDYTVTLRVTNASGPGTKAGVTIHVKP